MKMDDACNKTMVDQCSVIGMFSFAFGNAFGSNQLLISPDALNWNIALDEGIQSVTAVLYLNNEFVLFAESVFVR